MKYKVNDKILLNVEYFKAKRKILTGNPTDSLNLKYKDYILKQEEFKIIAKNEYLNTYLILIEQIPSFYMLGWNINAFHINNFNVDIKHLNAPFYEIHESIIIDKVK